MISGLSPDNDLSDKEAVQRFIAQHLGLAFAVTVVACRRLGAPVSGRVQRLLVTLETVQQATAVINAAKRLRYSLIPEIRDGVFINSDMTQAEQRAAYELRCRRRQARQRSLERRRGPDHRQCSSGQSARSTAVPSTRPSAVTAAVSSMAVDDGVAATNGARGASTAASSTSDVQSVAQSSVLSPSAPAFVSFIPSAPVTTDGSRRADGADDQLPADGINQLPSRPATATS